jgi:hypothetical protein
MKDYNFIDFRGKITSYKFYTEILSQLHEFFKQKSNKELLFNFAEIEFINPLVIPNILNAALILKTYYGKPIKAFIPWNQNLLSYLSDMDFLKIVKEYDLLELDENFIGGYTSQKINPECKTYCFEYGAEKERIRYELQGSLGILSEFYKRSDSELSDYALDEVLNIFTEICYNGCSHSGRPCFATVQAQCGKNIKYKKAYISISDCGLGFKSSFRNKPDYNTKIKFDSTAQHSLESIFEAIYFREDYTNYGIYHVTKNVINKGGVVRIHSDDIQVLLTEHSFGNFINSNAITSKHKLTSSFNMMLDGSSVDKVSSVRKTSPYKGVHIEIELPLQVTS